MVGDKVALLIRTVDEGREDTRKYPWGCYLQQRGIHSDQYKSGLKARVVKECYVRSQCDLCPQFLVSERDANQAVITQSVCGGQGCR